MSAPSRAKKTATVLPIPESPPVINAALPLSLPEPTYSSRRGSPRCQRSTCSGVKGSTSGTTVRMDAAHLGVLGEGRHVEVATRELLLELLQRKKVSSRGVADVEGEDGGGAHLVGREVGVGGDDFLVGRHGACAARRWACVSRRRRTRP